MEKAAYVGGERMMLPSARGVIAFSSGNHAQGVALAAALFRPLEDRPVIAVASGGNVYPAIFARAPSLPA